MSYSTFINPEISASVRLGAADLPRQGQVDAAHAQLGYRSVTGEASPAMSAPGYALRTAALVLGPRLHKLGYIQRGQYAEQIEEWLRHFPREQFLVLNFDDWKSELVAAAAGIAERLSLPAYEFQAAAANTGGFGKAMSEDRCECLTEHFRLWNTRLFNLLVEDWRWPC